jgi:hypothetical protein
MPHRDSARRLLERKVPQVCEQERELLLVIRSSAFSGHSTTMMPRFFAGSRAGGSSESVS